MKAILRILVAVGALALTTVPAPMLAVAAPASVTLSGPAGIEAGSCVDAQVRVQPDKPGQQVRLEEGGTGGWTLREARALDVSSSATFTVCEPWSRIAEDVSLRAVWPAQDPGNTEGVSGVLVVHVREAAWMVRIRRLVSGRGVGISVREAGTILYARGASSRRVPASNQKLLLSMAALDALGQDSRLRTVAAGPPLEAGIARGDLWILGDGDPAVGRSTLKSLAASLVAAGLRGVEGSVLGSKSGFSRDWFAPGWRRSFPREQVALPTALTYRGNQVRGRHIRKPERRAAAFLTRQLRRRGIHVGGRPGAGFAPGGLVELAAVESAPASGLLGVVNRASWNFGAEVLGKRIGLARSGAPGTISKGASAIAAWASARGVGLTANDSSGLSYGNRVSPAGITMLLEHSEAASWGAALRTSLPRPGQGTLRRRLRGVAVRAKTGTLSRISALSGYVRLARTDTWAEFSILSSGMSKARAVRLENRVVKILAALA